MPEKEETKQLNVWLPVELRDYVAQRAEDEKRGMNLIIADLIRQDMVQRQSDLVQGNTLALVREMLTEEMQKAHTQLRRSLRDDREAEAEEARDWMKKQVDRLAGLSVMAIRNAGIARRLVYAVLSKAHGPTFAKAVYDDAVEKAKKELLPKKTATDHVQSEEEE